MATIIYSAITATWTGLRNVLLLGRLPCPVTGLLLDPYELRIGIIGADMLQRSGELERVERNNTVVVYSQS